jgi:hypothetical protein
VRQHFQIVIVRVYDAATGLREDKDAELKAWRNRQGEFWDWVPTEDKPPARTRHDLDELRDLSWLPGNARRARSSRGPLRSQRISGAAHRTTWARGADRGVATSCRVL